MCAHKESPSAPANAMSQGRQTPAHCSAHLWNKEAKKAQTEVFPHPSTPPPVPRTLPTPPYPHPRQHTVLQVPLFPQ